MPRKRFTDSQKKYVLERDEYTCVFCGKRGAEVDHLVPISKGGQSIVENGICLCQVCNGKKNNKIEIDQLTRGIYWLLSKGEDMSWTEDFKFC